MNGQQRLDELDTAKGMGIMLIVLGHLEPGTYLMRLIYSFHIFLFFTCSGFVGKRYENRKTSTVVQQNMKRLLLPYLLWSILSQILDLITGDINISQAIHNVLFLDANVGWNAALWFLVALFWADTICSIVVKLGREAQYLAGAVFIGLCILLSIYRVVLPFGIYTIPIASIFWLLGYWINSYRLLERIKATKRIPQIAWGGVLLAICICFGTIFNSVISIYHIQYDNILFTMVAGVSGVLFVFMVSILVNNDGKVKRVLMFYGRNTLTILCTHYFVLRLIGVITQMIFGKNLWRYTSTLKSIVFAIIVIAVYYPVLLIKNRMKEKFPKLNNLM